MKRMLLAGAAVMVSLSVMPAQAEPVPWSDAEVDLVARDRPVTDFLKALFKEEGLTVTFDAEVSDIKGKLHGQFTGTAEDVFAKVAKSYGLVPYWDGSSVRISTSDSVASSMYKMSPEVGDAVANNIGDLNMGGGVNTVRRSRDGVVVVSGTPGFREAVDGVIRTQDSALRGPADAMVTKVFKLRYAYAHDTTRSAGGAEISVPGVATILRAVASGNGDGTSLRPTVEKKQLGVRRVTEVAGGRMAQGQQRFDPMTGQPLMQQAGGFEPQTAQFAREVQPLPNGMTIEADPRLNTIIIRDRAANMAGHAEVIEQLDVPAQVVAIEATIIDVDTSRLRELGVQWNGTGPDYDATTGGRITQGLPLGPGNFANPFAGGLLAAGGVVFGENVLSARVAALESEGVAKVVSRPQVMTLENVEAVFDNSNTFFVPVESQFDASLYEVTVGTLLSVVPDIVEEDGETRVKLIASVRDGRVTGNTVSGLPITNSAGVSSQGTMSIGQTLLFGGLTVDRDESFEDRVPVLGRVPLLGGLFKQQSKASSRVERMFLLTPRLIDADGNVMARAQAAPPPIVGQAAPELYRRPVPQPAPRQEPLPEPNYEPRPQVNEVSATGSAVTSNGLEVMLQAPASRHQPVMRGGQLFTDDCDDLDPYATCEDEA